MTVEQTLAQLVSIDSVSARSNAQIIAYLTERCEELDLRVRQFPYIDEAGVEKINLIAIAGTDFSETTNVELALVGHTDTVPYDPSWEVATKLTERDGKLFGRGACDTKGFIAAALTAAEGIDLKRLPKPLAFVFTADEEVGLIGAKRLARTRSLHARYGIVGEPTSLRPVRAGKGYCLAEIVVRGREAHSAYPALGASAICHAARLVSRIEKIAEEIRTEQHPDFDPPFTTLNVGLIRGGTAKNVVAGECRFTLEWRPIPGQDLNLLLDLVRSAIDAEKKLSPDVDCEIDAGRTDSAFETPAGSDVVVFLEELSGARAGTVAFATEAPQIMELGAEAVVFGPGDIRVAHRTGEFVPRSDLEQCAQTLAKAIERFCA
jgi:acetylornithine deacetylase